MGDLSALPGTGHGWLAKVLAGDPVACGVLALARTLSDAEWDAFAASVDRIRAGMPAANLVAVLRQEQSGKHPRFG